MSLELTLPPAAASVPAARRFVVESAAGLPGDVRDALALIVSELATNCVQHARSGFRLRVERADSTIRVEVADTGSGTAALRSPGPTEPHGRGLSIVDTLADEWGVEPATPEVGKTVWVRLRFEPAYLTA